MSDVNVNNIEEKLKACERDVAAIDLGCLNELSLKETNKKIVDFILLASNVAEVLNSCLQIAQSCLPINVLGPLPMCLEMLTSFIKIYFHKDFESILTEHFRNANSVELTICCRKACDKIRYFASYIQNMPNTENTDEKRFQLLSLAIEFPLNDALIDVLNLRSRMQHMMEDKKLETFEELAFLFQLYCIQSTLTEMYLLYRIAKMSLYGENPSPLIAVLQTHHDNDKDILTIAYRPTKKTVEIYMNCELYKWPILISFLSRRKLLSESITDFRAMIEIRPLKESTKCIAYETKIGKCCHKEKKIVLAEHIETEYNKLFWFRQKRNGAYLIYSLNGKVFANGDSLIISEDDDDEWYVLKLFPDSEKEKPAYVIGPANDRKTCLCFKRDGICLTTFSGPVENFLWTFDRSEEYRPRLRCFYSCLSCMFILRNICFRPGSVRLNSIDV